MADLQITIVLFVKFNVRLIAQKKGRKKYAYDFTCIHVQLMQAQVILCWLKLTLPVHLHILNFT